MKSSNSNQSMSSNNISFIMVSYKHVLQTLFFEKYMQVLLLLTMAYIIIAINTQTYYTTHQKTMDMDALAYGNRPDPSGQKMLPVSSKGDEESKENVIEINNPNKKKPNVIASKINEKKMSE